jgi:hypothetical protein
VAGIVLSNLDAGGRASWHLPLEGLPEAAAQPIFIGGDFESTEIKPGHEQRLTLCVVDQLHLALGDAFG